MDGRMDVHPISTSSEKQHLREYARCAGRATHVLFSCALRMHVSTDVWTACVSRIYLRIYASPWRWAGLGGAGRVLSDACHLAVSEEDEGGRRY